MKTQETEDDLTPALHLLGVMGDKRAFDTLITFFNHSDQFVRSSAVQALGSLEDERATPYLVKALQDSDPWVRWRAVHALGQLESDAAVIGLIGALGDKGRLYPRHIESVDERRIGEIAQRYLVEIGRPVIELLINAFEAQTNDALLQSRIGVILVELGDYRAVGDIISTLDEMLSYEITMWAKSVQALVKVSTPQAIETLSRQAEDNSDNPWIRATAKQAVLKIHISNGTVPPDMMPYVKDTEYYFREAARELLSHFPSMLKKTPHQE